MKTLDQIHLPAHERAAIEEAAALLRQKFPIKQIILFGSKARGDSDEESDIDLLLLTARDLTEAERDSVLPVLSPIQNKYQLFFGTIKLSEEEWYNGIYQVLPLRTEVERDGVTV